MSKKPTVLMILDGYGLNKTVNGNAVVQARTPVMDELKKEYPFVKGNASGMAVGLPDGQMGNSEVGHLNMGAGRIVYQELTRITKEIEDGTFFENEALLNAVKNCKENRSALHLFGLLSDGGVHSHNTHLYGLLELAKRNRLSHVYVHCFLDGRDTPPSSGKDFAIELQQKMKEIGIGQIASVMGRYYAMDRDKRFDRVNLAYEAIVDHKGNSFTDPVQFVKDSYTEEVFDEFVVPGYNSAVDGAVEDNDSVIFANFRPDRAIQIATVMTNPDFYADKGYTPATKRNGIYFVCMMKYADSVNGHVAFALPELTNTFGDYVSAQGLKQLRIAETEKYAHVTFFFDGGEDKEIEGAKRDLINSPKVATYDLQPEMSAYLVKDKLIEELDSGEFDVVIVNFANCDMVGHTGVEAAAIKAVEAVDECVGKAVEALKEVDGQMFICADHGNAEQLVDYETGEPYTAHTTNPVPFILVNADPKYTLRENGCLADIIPTLIQLMGMEQPAEMTGKSLLVEK